MPLPGWGEAIRRPWLDGRGWSAWQALVAEADGTTINSAGNPVHFTGIVWAGMHGEPIEAAPGPGEVAVALGRLPGGAARGLAADRRLRAEVLHVPRGRRPGAAAAAGGGDAGDRTGGGGRPRLRVHRLGGEQVALDGAQPAGHPHPPLSRLAPPPAGAGAAGDRGRVARRLGRGRLGRPEAARERRSARLAAAPARRAPGDPPRAPYLRRRLRRRADRRTSTRPSSRRSPARSPRAWPSAPTGASSAPCCASRAGRWGGSGSR